MSWLSLLCGQGAMLLFVAGSHRGNRVFWRDRLTASQQRILKSCATALLCVSLVAQAMPDGGVVLNVIEWILLVGPEIMVATLACSLWEQRARP